MKILFIGRYNESESLTGPEKVAKRIFNKCSEDFETIFITYFFDGNKYSLFSKLFGKEKIKEPGTGKIFRLGLFRILICMFSFKPDIIHIITFERFARISFLYKVFRKTIIYYTVHGIAAFENSINPGSSEKLRSKDYQCEKKFFAESDKLIFLSEISVVTAEKYFEIDKNKINIIPNGIDKIFHQAAEGKKINYSNPLKIVFSGDANKKEKGYEFLSGSLEKINLPAEVFIVGSNYEFSKFSNHCINFTFSERMDTVTFAEFLSDKDIFISASYYEQFSMITVEAMAAALIPIVTEETGMSSYIDNGKNGFTITYGDTGSLVMILESIESGREKAEQISAEAKKIYTELSWDMVYGKYKKLYE